MFSRTVGIPLTDDERAQVARAKAGDLTGLRGPRRVRHLDHAVAPELWMPRYGSVWLEIAEQQYRDLPADYHELIDQRLA